MTNKKEIPIKEYREILNTLELDNICLIESSFKLFKEKLPSKIKILIKETAKFETKDTYLIIRYKSILKGVNEESQEAGVIIETIHELHYTSSGEKVITPEFLDKFSNYSASMIVWPYFREYVQSMLSKTQMPPLTLPLKKIG